MHLAKHTLLGLSIGLGTVGTAAPLVTDRPDVTESSAAVAPGKAQLEAGVRFSEGADGASGENYLGSLARVGVAEDWELRVGWDGFSGGEGAEGPGDASIGFKHRFLTEDGLRPATALLARTSAPVGEDAVSSDAFDPAALFAFSHTLSERASLGYNVGIEAATRDRASGGDTTRASATYSAALGYGVTERLGVFAEIFGAEGLSADASPVSADGGITWLLSDEAQLDAFAGAGLNDDAEAWFIGAGYSIRWSWGSAGP